MFERFTERARRVVFFARYEASDSGASEIGSEHFLLGLCRETALKEALPVDTLRAELKTRKKPRVSTSVDMPLNHEVKRILARAAEESERAGSKDISCLHLTLGMFRESDSRGAQLMLEHGLTTEEVRKLFAARSAQTASGNPHVEAAISRLAHLGQVASMHLHGCTPQQAETRLIGESWTRIDALEHLIDLAVAHDRWICLHLKIGVAEFEGVQARDWEGMTAHWSQLHTQILVHLSRVSPDRWTVLLIRLVDSYTARLEAILNEIIAP